MPWPYSSRITSINLSNLVGLTCELPLPWYRGFSANSPITAIFLYWLLSSGNSFLEFLSSVIASAETLRANWWCSSTLISVGSCWLSCAKNTIRRISFTTASNCFSSNSLFLIASTIILLVILAGLPGISKCIPARIPWTRSTTASQSDTTKPLKPHSFLSLSVSSLTDSVPYSPWTRL